MQGVDLDAKQTMTAGRNLRSGASFRSSFRSRPQTCQSGDGNESQQGVEDVDMCRVDCWNGGYMEGKGQAAALRDQQDWMAHNKEVVHGLQVRLTGSAAVAYSCWLVPRCVAYEAVWQYTRVYMRQASSGMNQDSEGPHGGHNQGGG